MIIEWMQKLVAIPQANPEHKQIEGGQTMENDGPDPGQTAPSPVLLFEWNHYTALALRVAYKKTFKR